MARHHSKRQGIEVRGRDFAISMSISAGTASNGVAMVVEEEEVAKFY